MSKRNVTPSYMLRDTTGAKNAFDKNFAVQCADILLCDGDEFQFARFKLKAISTQGKTNACMSLYTE
jgi:glyoxylase-like metal-dependent hydrolase (beta-lactamase superfamily II)